jgi:hypothetical protein
MNEAEEAQPLLMPNLNYPRQIAGQGTPNGHCHFDILEFASKRSMIILIWSIYAFTSFY